MTPYREIAAFAWHRAHLAKNRNRLAFWFHIFDVASGLADAFETRTLH